jgi:hypothetical protein
MVRFFGGGLLLAWGLISIALNGQSLGAAIAVLLAVYPLMTTAMGWDPFYALFGARSCSVEGGRNQCGTFPYQVDSALGNEPRPRKGHGYDRSLAGAVHETRRGKAA